MISQFVGSSPTSGTVLTAWSLERALDSVSPSLSFPSYTHSLSLKNKHFLKRRLWAPQSVEHPTLAQVMISQFVGSSPTLGSVLTAQNLEPALDSVSLLSLPLPHSHCLSLSLKNK